MFKIYSIQLSYEVSDQEKEQAEKVLICFDYAIKSLKQTIDHLNIMTVPFKDDPNIKTEEVVKYRAALRRYRDKVVSNFNNFKSIILKCINELDLFMSDTQTSKLVRTLISTIDSLEDQVNKMSEIFNKLESKTFIIDLNKALDEIHKLCDELKEIIDDRIKGHIKNNIIGKTWLNSVENKVHDDNKSITLVDLMRQRESQLEEIKR